MVKDLVHAKRTRLKSHARKSLKDRVDELEQRLDWQDQNMRRAVMGVHGRVQMLERPWWVKLRDSLKRKKTNEQDRA